MVDWVGLVMWIVYFYGKIIGVFNFEFDWRSGCVYTTPLTTLYAAAANISIVVLLAFQFTGRTRLFGSVKKLHEYVIIVLTVLRITTGLITLLNRWRQRSQIMDLIRNVLRRFLARPGVVQISRWGILVKFLVSSLTDVFQISISLEAIGRLDSTVFLGTGLLFWTSAILNLTIAQHFFVTLFVRADYELLNTELRKVIEECNHLSNNQQRRGVFMTRCCYLADKVEDIAKLQDELQSIMNQLYEVLGNQGMLVYVGYYISVVATNYLTYSVFKYGYTDLGLTLRSVILALIWCFFYYLDASINLFTTLSVQDGHREMIRLLQDRTLFANGLDVRLEQSFESLQLQLVRNPLKMRIMKLFTFSKMLDWASLLLKGVYYYGHLIGLSNFEFNWRTGRVFTAAKSTLFAIVTNAIFVILFGFLLTRHINFKVVFGNSNRLHEVVVITMSSLRVAGGISTVFNRWRQRRQMMALARKILRLFLAKPQVIKMSRRGIFIKFFTSIVTDFVQLGIAVDAIGRGDSTFFLAMCLQFWMSGILTLAISQHYLVMLFVRAQYHLLNMDLRKVIDESMDLSHHPPRKGVFMTRCCHLADRLEDIAKLQSQLQDIVTRLEEVFGIQGLMVYGGYYISSVSACYLTFSIVKNGPENLAMTYTSLVLIFAWCIFYYWDAILNLFVMLYVQDDHKKMIHLLEKGTLFASGLDVRLEESFESLQLQLIRNPLKIEVLHTFSINRDSTSAVVGSLITHSIYLIQYDIEFF